MRKKHLVWLIAVLTLTWALSKLDIQTLSASAQERYSELQTFSKVLNLVQQYYVEPVEAKKLIQGAIKGMLRELDPHTNYLAEDAFKELQSETSGEFGGLGIEITMQNNVLTVISPIEDTPAWEAGVQAGDKVIAVNGTSTKGLSLIEASQLMRGARGSKVTLSIVRNGKDDPMDIKITRGSVKLKSVKTTDLGDGFWYVRVTSFIENTGRDLERALTGKSVKGLILDLRKNPGGLLNQAVAVSDLFLKEGKIVSTIGRNKQAQEVSIASKKAKWTDFPIIILVNEHTASASEIVAGALQDNKRAMVMGKRSFGKGSVQQVIQLGDGTGLKLTVARYYTPSGKSIQAEGITPDIEVEDVDMAQMQGKAGNILREKDISGHLEGDQEKADRVKKESANNPIAWWKDIGSKKDEAKTPKDKLLSGDYQAYQAYSYLKAWKVIRQIN